MQYHNISILLMFTLVMGLLVKFRYALITCLVASVLLSSTLLAIATLGMADAETPNCGDKIGQQLQSKAATIDNKKALALANNDSV